MRTRLASALTPVRFACSPPGSEAWAEPGLTRRRDAALGLTGLAVAAGPRRRYCLPSDGGCWMPGSRTRRDGCLYTAGLVVVQEETLTLSQRANTSGALFAAKRYRR